MTRVWSAAVVGVTGVPETYVIGRDGMVLAKHTGPLDQAKAEKLAKLAR